MSAIRGEETPELWHQSVTSISFFTGVSTFWTLDDPEITTNWPCSPSCPKPLFQSEAKCKAIDLKLIFHSHAKKTPGGRGCFQKNWVGVCGTLPETFSLFQIFPTSVIFLALFQT